MPWADIQAWDLLEPTLWLVGALLAAALILLIFQRWTAKDEVVASSASDQLSEFRELYEAGELSQEEYHRLHALLGGRIKKEQPPEPKPLPPADTIPPVTTPEPVKQPPDAGDSNS